MTLRLQLSLLVVLAVVASLVAAGVLTLRFTRTALENDARSTALESAREFNADLSALIPVTNDTIGKHIEADMRRNRHVVDVDLLLNRVDGHTFQFKLESRSDLLVTELPTPTQPIDNATAAAQMRAIPAVADTPRGIEVTMPLHHERPGGPHGAKIEKPRIGTGTITVTYSLESVDKLVAIQKKVTGYVALIAVLLASLLTVLLADRIIGRPLARLAKVMGEVSQGSLDRRVPSARSREIRAVTTAFNRMLDRLQEADREIRSFNERLANEVQAATSALSDRNVALNHLNVLLMRAREDLSHKERLAALGQLAAQLAHEVGTPLGSVSGHLQLALASPDCSQSVRDRLVIASQEIARVSRIIRDYLDSTRRIEPEVSTVPMERIIHEAVEVARGGNPARNAAVAVEIAPEASSWRTDEGVTRQILVNLIANALDAVATVKDSDTKAVIVRAQLEESKTPVRPELVLRVSDNGPGLSAEALGRLFEPFYTTKGRGRGTGLGLAISRELAQSLGGRIDGASEPGRGTTFTVRLPNADDIPRRGQASASKPAVSVVH